MHEEIISYLREHSEGVSSQFLAETYLKFKNPDNVLAHTAIYAILKKDSRCFVDKYQKWHTNVKKKSGLYLKELPLTLVHCLSDLNRNSKSIFFISLWDIKGDLVNLFSAWLVNPHQFASETDEMFIEGTEFFDKNIPYEQNIGLIYQKLKNRIPVFLSSYDCTLVRNALGQCGYYLSDDCVFITELLKAAQLEIPRPLTLQSLMKNLNQQVILPTEVKKGGFALATGTRDLIDIVIGRGLETRDEMEEVLFKDNTSYFFGKDFSLKTIQSLPTTPGVYGFKKLNGEFIYIGKAKNLKRRLLGYFRDSDESPEKIKRLRNESHSFITYQCGSELEALIYEYRLIRKHSPILNSKIAIDERSGKYLPIQDCIIILQHIDREKIMSFWFRENQKIIIKPVDLINIDEKDLKKEINDYFYVKSLPAEKSDFPEMELATRWIKSNRDSIEIIEVYNCADAAEVVELFSFSIKQIQRDGESL